jgi:hypothetical protein
MSNTLSTSDETILAGNLTTQNNIEGKGRNRYSCNFGMRQNITKENNIEAFQNTEDTAFIPDPSITSSFDDTGWGGTGGKIQIVQGKNSPPIETTTGIIETPVALHEDAETTTNPPVPKTFQPFPGEASTRSDPVARNPLVYCQSDLGCPDP